MSLFAQMQAFRQLTEKQIRSAAARAINRAAVTMKAEAARCIKDELGALKIGDIKDLIDISRTTAREDLASMKAVLAISRKQTPLALYNPLTRNVTTERGKRLGVTVKIKGERKLVRDAFLITTKGGYTGVFQRTGDSRYPLKQVFGTSIADVLRNAEVLEDLRRTAQTTVADNFKAELSYQLSKSGFHPVEQLLLKL